MSSSVFIAGPAAWNTIVVLDRLPEPVPHMQFAEATWETVGGTSAGKALSLTGLGRPTQLYALAGDDAAGTRVREALDGAGVAVRWGAGVTERHLNLMTRDGERVSLYLAASGRVHTGCGRRCGRRRARHRASGPRTAGGGRRHQRGR